jgi:SpoU rRNA methylase family enzyme
MEDNKKEIENQNKILEEIMILFLTIEIGLTKWSRQQSPKRKILLENYLQ